MTGSAVCLGHEPLDLIMFYVISILSVLVPLRHHGGGRPDLAETKARRRLRHRRVVSGPT